MTPTTSPLASLILVRLLVGKQPPAPAKLANDLRELLPTPPTSNELAETLAGLESAGLADRRRVLTDAGRRQALNFLGLSELPPRSTWASLKKLLAMRALGLTPTAEVRGKLAKTEALQARLLRQRFGLATKEWPTLTEALQALAWKQLGIDSAMRFTHHTVLAQRFLERPDTESKKVPGQLSAKFTGARNSRPGEFVQALVRQWLRGNEVKAAPPPDKSSDLPAFASRVRNAARQSATGRFGNNKVFINHVWRTLQDGAAVSLTLDSFKDRLVQAHQQGLVSLSRADLVEAMDETDVAESATRHLNATFHFIRLEPGETS